MFHRDDGRRVCKDGHMPTPRPYAVTSKRIREELPVIVGGTDGKKVLAWGDLTNVDTLCVHTTRRSAYLPFEVTLCIFVTKLEVDRSVQHLARRVEIEKRKARRSVRPKHYLLKRENG